jgi:hypothetical protein
LVENRRGKKLVIKRHRHLALPGVYDLFYRNIVKSFCGWWSRSVFYLTGDMGLTNRPIHAWNNNKYLSLKSWRQISRNGYDDKISYGVMDSFFIHHISPVNVGIFQTKIGLSGNLWS